MYYIYMIRCKDNSIYTGITTDIKRRWQEHSTRCNKCAKYTLNHHVEKIEALWKTETRVLASKLEFFIKKLDKKQKEELIQTHNLYSFFESKLLCNEYKIEKINISY